MSTKTRSTAGTLIESEHLACLLPTLQRALPLKLQARTGAAPSVAFGGDGSYAWDVFSCVSELDASLKSLALVRQFIEDLESNANEDLDAFRYHYENFIFRGVGIVDRAYQLVATTLCMSRSVRGKNPRILQKCEAQRGVHGALLDVAEAFQSYRSTRNLIAHAEEYSDKRLSTLTTLKALKIVPEGDAVEKVTADLYEGALRDVDEAYSALHGAAQKLLQALGPVIETKLADLSCTTSPLSNA